MSEIGQSNLAANAGNQQFKAQANQQASNGGPPRRRTARDYQFGTRIGEGSYSTVYSAVDLYNKKTYAVKILSKKHIVQEGKVKYVNIEKTTLHRLGVQHPGIVQLYYTFQDESSLFFVLDFAEYGELLSIISKFGSLSEQVSRFYMLQILDAVKFIHSKGVIHRDLKPENILVGYDFNLKITDFGAAKLIGEDEDQNDEKITYDSVKDDQQNGRSERKGSFVGTAEYVPPELLKFNLCGFETDIWAIACILFQFFNGVPPFKGTTEYLTFEKIISVSYSYRETIPNMVKDIIESILVFEPQKRPSVSEIQAMPWFKGVPWNNREYIWNRKVPRFEPYGQSSPVNSNRPQFKTGSNRNFNKSNSNYQLHSQIQKFDNLIPAFGSKPSYMPPTRLKKGLSSTNVSQAPMQANGQHNMMPVQNQSSMHQHHHQHHQHHHSPTSPARIRQKHSNAAYRQMPMGGPAQPPQHQMQYSPQIQQQSASYIAAQQASAIMAYANDSEPQVTTKSPHSPELNNLRLNTAFANLQRPSQVATKSQPASPSVPPSATLPAKPVSVAKPQAINRPPQAQLPQVPSQPQSKSNSESPSTGKVAQNQTLSRPSIPQSKPQSPQSSTSSSKSPKPATKQPITITLKEISSFLDADEKIIKLDSVLKSMLSNKLIDRKPGSLDDEAIERLIDRHQAVLDDRMAPVIACISNKAKVFLIDESLEVMMVDLTANKGGDYSMYDYEFESLLVEDEHDFNETNGKEEVFGYLILELIKEGGDLIFLKRFNEEDKKKYSTSLKVVSANGQGMKIGTNFGWIDCLIKAKEIVDRDLKTRGEKGASTATGSQSRQKTSSRSSSAKPSRNSSSKGANKAKGKSAAKSSKSSTEEQNTADSKSAVNKFAFAAATAAHR